MTAPSLAEALAELARRVPGRVRTDARREIVCVEVRQAGQWRYVYYFGAPTHGWASHGLGQMWLEYGLREELDARGISWLTGSLYDHGISYGSAVGGECDDMRGHEADTPAESVVLALLAALKAEGGAQ